MTTSCGWGQNVCLRVRACVRACVRVQSGSVDLTEFTAWVNREMDAAQDPQKEELLRQSMEVGFR